MRYPIILPETFRENHRSVAGIKPMRSFLSSIPSRFRSIPRTSVVLFLEILAVAGWTCFVGMEYLDFNPRLLPEGLELIPCVQSHAMWIAFQRCGLCFLWNGSTNGGAPSFIEMYGAPLHPVVMISTLLFGFINGIKATLLLSLAIAGLAQLWLGRILKLHPLVRLWCAGIAVAGGHLSGRMDDGIVSIVLSTACCSLIIPAFLQFLLSASRRNTVILSLTLASAILSGHAYMQIGFAVSILPGFVLLGFLFHRPKVFPWRRLFFSGGLALLLTAFFLVPLLHFLPLFQKHSDPTFFTAQPLQYLPLNLVISDPEYFMYPDLGKVEKFIFAYANYIGWLPILLAAFACTLRGEPTRKFSLLFLGSTVLVYLAASAWTFRLLGIFNPDLAGGIRYPAMIAGLAPPLILAMSGLGAQAVLVHPWPVFLLRIRQSYRLHLQIPVRVAAVLFLMTGMILSLVSVVEFSLPLLVAQPTLSIPEEIFRTVSTAEVEWVQTPFLEYGWFPEMLDRNMKIAVYQRPWDMKLWDVIEPRFLIFPNLPEPEVNPGWELIRRVGNYRIYFDEHAHYAVLRTADGEIPCTAKGLWGDLEVTCQSDAGGLLEVKEFAYSGWQAAVDGKSAKVGKTVFLSVLMPAGLHTASFRYRPWDVPAGLLISIFGWILSAAYLWRGRKEPGAVRVGEEIQPLDANE